MLNENSILRFHEYGKQIADFTEFLFVMDFVVDKFATYQVVHTRAKQRHQQTGCLTCSKKIAFISFRSIYFPVAFLSQTKFLSRRFFSEFLKHVRSISKTSQGAGYLLRKHRASFKFYSVRPVEEGAFNSPHDSSL